MTPEQALACIEQERLDVMAEGMSEADCNMTAAYVLASAYRKLVSARPEALQKDRILAALRKLQFTNGDVHINGRSIGGHWNKHLQGFIDEVESALSPLRQKTGMEMMMELSPSRAEAMLERLKADAVVSKFVTARECQAYRQAVDDMLAMIRAGGKP